MRFRENLFLAFLLVFMVASAMAENRFALRGAAHGAVQFRIESFNPDISSVEVWRSANIGEIGIRVFNGPPAEFSNLRLDDSPELENGRTYFYTVYFKDSRNRVVETMNQRVMVDNIPPEPPVAKVEPDSSGGDFNWIGWLESVSNDVRYYWTLWAEVNDTANFVGIRNDTTLRKGTTRDRIDNLDADKRYFYFVKAVDYSNNESPWVGSVNSYQKATRPADVLTAAAQPAGEIHLAWDAAKINNWVSPGLTSYKLYRSTDPNFVVEPVNLIATLPLNQTTYIDRPNQGLQHGRTYYYHIVAYDPTMVESFDEILMSFNRVQATCDALAPCQPEITDVVFAQYDPQKRLNVQWEDNCAITADSFQVFLTMDPDTTIPFMDSTGYLAAADVAQASGYAADILRPSYCGIYYVAMKAKDIAGNPTGYTSFYQVNLDHTRPAAPKNPVASCQADGTIHLGWDEAYDDCDDEGLTYNVFRRATAAEQFIQIASNVEATEYYDRSVALRCGGYEYRIQAIDQAGNEATEVATVVGYSVKNPNIVDGEGCFRTSATLRCQDISDRLFGGTIEYWYEFEQTSDNAMVFQSGWQADRSFTLPDNRFTMLNRTSYTVKVKARFTLDGDICETGFATTYVEQNFGTLPAVTNLHAESQTDGNVRIGWRPPVTDASPLMCNTIDSYTLYIYDQNNVLLGIRDNIVDTFYVDRAYVGCERLLKYKVLAVDRAGNGSRLEDADEVSAISAPAPVWTDATIAIPAINLNADTLRYRVTRCSSLVVSYIYQIAYGSSFADSVIVENQTQNSTEFSSDQQFFVISPPVLDVNPCDTIYFRIRAVYQGNYMSPYSTVLTKKVDMTPPVPPTTFTYDYISGKANLYWQAGSDDCSAVEGYRLRIKKDATTNPFYTAVVNTTSLSVLRIFDRFNDQGAAIDITTNGQYYVYLYAIDRAGNESPSASTVLQLETMPAPAEAPTLIYYHADRYYISPDSLYFAPGDTHTVYLTYNKNLLDTAQYLTQYEVSTDPLFSAARLKFLSDWTRPDANEGGVPYHFAYTFGKNGRGQLIMNDPQQPLYYRARVNRTLYHDTSAWSNVIHCVQDSAKPTSSNNQIYYTKRPFGVQVIRWQDMVHSLIEAGSGLKYMILEGSRSSNFASGVDTSLVIPFTSADTTMDTVVKINRRAEDPNPLPFYLRFKLIDQVGNTNYIVTSPRVVYFSFDSITVTLRALDATLPTPQVTSNKQPVEIEIYAPDVISAVRYKKYLDVGNDTDVVNKDLYVLNRQTSHLIDTLDLVVNESLNFNFTGDGYRYITPYLYSAQYDLIGNATEHIFYDTTPPTTVIKEGCEALPAGVDTGTIIIQWSHSRDTSGIYRYDIYRQEGRGDSIMSHLLDSIPANSFFNMYTDTRVETEKRYYYQIVPVDYANNQQTASEAFSVWADFTSPAAPQVSVLPDFLASNNLNLTLIAGSHDIKTLNVYFSKDGSFNQNQAYTKTFTNLVWQGDTLKLTGFSQKTFANMLNYIAIEMIDSTGNKSELFTASCADCDDVLSVLIDDEPPAPVSRENLSVQRIPSQQNPKNRLSWRAVEDNLTGIMGYRIYRSMTPEVDSAVVGALIATVPPMGQEMHYFDTTITPTAQYYYVAAPVDSAGNENFRQSGVTSDQATFVLAKEEAVIPQKYALWQNFPNPFNPTTTIAFDVPAGYDGTVTLDIYNIVGERIARLLNQSMSPGAYRVTWHGCDETGREVGTGLYFYRLQLGTKFQAGKKMLFLK